MEKAFDSVWHAGIVYKLIQLNTPTYLLRIIANFLVCRTLRVSINGTLSRQVSLGAGTPQGSVLSPLLYNIFVNDMPLHYQDTRAGQFADDLSKWTSAKRKETNFLKLQKSLNLILDWCRKWRVNLNPSKTQIITFTKTKRPTTLSLTLNKFIIRQNNYNLN